MNFAALKTELSRLLELEGWTNTTYAIDTGEQINQALAQFSLEAGYVVAEYSSMTTVSGTHTYTLPNELISVLTDVIVGGVYPLTLTTEDQIRRWNPVWTQNPSGTPAYWFWVAPSKIRLFPTPSQTGQVIFVRGREAEPTLVNNSDEPLLESAYHLAIPNYAAWNWAKAYAQGEAKERITVYRAEVDRYLQAMDVQKGEALQSALQRTVMPRYRFIYTGGNPYFR